MRKVLIPTKLNSISKELLEAGQFAVVQDADVDISELAEAHPDAVGLIIRSEKVNSSVIDKLPKLKVIVRAGAGFNTIDIKYARRQGIDVMNTPGANSNAVAEEVLAMILCVYRHIIEGDVTTRRGLWEKAKLMGRELTGKTVGIVGLGNIGRLVAKRLSGFECTVLGYDPVISDSKAEELGVALCSMDELFSRSDVVTLHIPESSETKGIINRKLFELMPENSVLVNCARSGILNENDLREVKKEKAILFCNDVYEKDEAGNKSVADIADIMLPHLGASTIEANVVAARRAAEQLIALIDRGVTTHVVNKAVPDGLDEEHQQLAYYLSRVGRCFLGCDKHPIRIEISLYGGLKEYANWLLGPIVAGISTDFDPMFDRRDPTDFLNEKGITFINRDVDKSKQYGKSITLDLFEGSGKTLTKASIRGTVTEGNPMVSRIDGFDKLYFDPIGKSVLVVYPDRPGMLAIITSVIARHDVNINDIRCPYDPVSKDSIAILKVNRDIENDVLTEILRESGAAKAVYMDIG